MLVRILLDTCTIRNHLHAIGKRLDFDSIRSSTEQLRFSLPGGTGVELLEQLTEGRLHWSVWTNGIQTIDSILDQRWPLLPTGRQLAAIAGTQSNIEIDIESERRHLQAVWRLQCQSKSTTDLQRGSSFVGADGQRYAIRLERSNLQSTVTALRDSWKNYIRRMQTLFPSIGVERASEEDILNLMGMGLGTFPGDPPDLGDKLDSVSRMIASLVSMAMKSKNPYNPVSDRRRGDAFDISLLFYVPLPSVICTADEKFVNRLRDTGTQHTRQVVSVDQFNKFVKDGCVGTLVRDFRTSDEQHRRWSEAAYFNWIRRDRPPCDDQRDWFDAEPIS